MNAIDLNSRCAVITGGASVVTAIVSVMLLKENMGTVNWLGLLLVCTGIYLLFSGKA